MTTFAVPRIRARARRRRWRPKPPWWWVLLALLALALMLAAIDIYVLLAGGGRPLSALASLTADVLYVRVLWPMIVHVRLKPGWAWSREWLAAIAVAVLGTALWLAGA